MATAKKKPRKSLPGSGTTRARVFSATVELVCKGGPAAATARAICEKAQITAPTLYYYFSDLSVLYNEVLELMFVPEIQAHPGKEETDPRGMIDYMWECCIGTATDRPGIVELKNQMLATSQAPSCMVKFYARLERAFVQISRREKLNFPPKISAAMFWSAATGLATRIAAAQRGDSVVHVKGTEAALKFALLNSIFCDPQSPPTTTGKPSATRIRTKV